MDERRYFGLDALRGGMMLLGILFHAAMLYLAAPPPSMPMPSDPNNWFGFDILFGFIHSFRMPVFFVMAGFFASLLVDKRGLRGTLGNRAARIAAPLALAIFTILPLTALLHIDFMLSARFGTHTLIPERPLVAALAAELAAKGMPVQPMLAHLWFLYYLCFFYLLLPACRALVRIEAFNQRIRRWLNTPWLVTACVLVTAATLWPYQGGQVHEGFIYFKPHLPSLLYYGWFFVCGYVLHQQRDGPSGALPALMRRVPAAALLAAALFPLSMVASHLDHSAHGVSVALHAMAVLANAACTWALICFFTGSALRFFDRASPWSLYVSQSSYWVFLIHMPLVLLAGWWLVPFDLPAMVKFLLVCSFTAVGGFVSFHYAVQKSWLSDLLHGRRFNLQWPWQAQESAQQSQQ